MRLNKVIILLCLSTGLALAQGVKPLNLKDLPVSISIGSASNNSYTKSLPASLIYTYPDSDTIKNSYAGNAYISIGKSIFNENIHLSFIAEMHRNTLIAKEQNTKQFGLSAKCGFLLGSAETPWLIPQLDVSVVHSEDKVKDKKGMQFLGYTYLEYAFNCKSKFITMLEPGGIYPVDKRGNNATADTPENLKKQKAQPLGYFLSDWIQIRHTNSFGIEHIKYESLTMFNASFGVEVYPFSGLLYQQLGQYNLLQLRYGFAHRSNLNDAETDLFVGFSQKYSANINLKLDPKGKSAITLGYEYSEGGNPLKGLADTSFGQLKLSLIANIGQEF